MTLAKSKLRVVGIDHVVLHVRDLDRSKRFYMDLLGFEMHHEGGRNAFLRGGNQLVALFERKDEDVAPGREMNHMALRLEAGEYAEVKAALEAQGIQVGGRPGDPHCIYFSDPDGHRLQVLMPGEEG